MNKQTLYYSLVTAIAGALANNAYEKTNTATSAKAGADAIRNYGASVKAMAKAVTEAVWEEYEDKEPEKDGMRASAPSTVGNLPSTPTPPSAPSAPSKQARLAMLEEKRKRAEQKESSK